MSWWIEPLTRWAKALDIDYQIELYQFGPDVHKGWHQVGGHWYYRLDGAMSVHFLTDELSDAMRDALGWTLEQASVNGAPSSLSVREQYEELWRIDFAQLVTRLADQDTSLNFQTNHLVFPGYFLLLQRRGEHGSHTDHADAHWVQVLPDVLSATFENNLYTVLTDEHEYVLVYASESVLQNAIDELPDVDESSCTVNNLVKLAQTVTSTVAEDAFFDVRVAVSRRMETERDLYTGLVSTVLVSRLRGDYVNASVPDVFGATPLQLYVKLTSHMARIGFHSMLLARSKEPIENWPEDWMTLVQAVVEANLNISEAARKLFVHRNTLLHKVDRLAQLTGYDVRNTNDAMILYIASLLYA